jgi:hypothetical protein
LSLVVLIDGRTNAPSSEESGAKADAKAVFIGGGRALPAAFTLNGRFEIMVAKDNDKRNAALNNRLQQLSIALTLLSGCCPNAKRGWHPPADLGVKRY